ncbi:uncharacterized protein LOC130625662 [Hydractinia symbiolongicarpus]|uniref:uncharacterized protein LOC130625662 n=1 Tax=Hydractinia symbiolongicarpus TaxID=13093 RepID=UPI00254C5D37|nr:uncharacterized protein LOC130625662 [Hydractinia symbiolongicarpus]
MKQSSFLSRIKLLTFMFECEKFLRNLFHDKKLGNFPRNEEELYETLNKLKKNGKLKNLSPQQLEIALPKSKKTDSSKFDLSLLCHLLLNSKNLKSEMRNAVKEIKKERNFVIHNPNVSYSTFLKRWDNIENNLAKLGYVTEVQDLKLKKLDDLKAFETSISKSKRELQSNDYYIYNDHHGNLDLRFTGDWSVQTVEIDDARDSSKTKELSRNKDFTDKKQENKLNVTVKATQKMQKFNQISIRLIDSQNNAENVFIEDIAKACAHQYDNDVNAIHLLTHNSASLSQQINQISQTESVTSQVEIICNKERKLLTRSDYKKFANGYIDRYFTRGDSTLQKSVQFPSLIRDQKVSVFAHKIKEALTGSKYDHSTFFTNYDTNEHLKFLNLQSGICCEQASCTNRILLLCDNMIINIRYTETTDAESIQDECKKGENDLLQLAIIKQSIVRDKMVLVSVVAAPKFEKDMQMDICVDCKVLRKNICESNQFKDFFLNMLGEKLGGRTYKEPHSSMMSQIMCFMAMRQMGYKVPVISEDDVHEQVKSVMLSNEQLRFLHAEAKKKIIIGPLGSGKTILAQCHLKDLYDRCESKCIIYYVIWNDKSLLLKNVIDFKKTFDWKDNVTVEIKNIVELSKEMKLSKLPKISQLLPLVINKHSLIQVHMIADEIDGEMFDTSEASALKQYFETEKNVQESVVVLFPQSIEKHRTFECNGHKTIYNTYEYEKTGMTVLRLKLAMRTSELIFKFLKAFEEKITANTTETNLPDLKSKDPATESEKIVLKKQDSDKGDGLVKVEEKIVPDMEEKPFEPLLDIDIVTATLDETKCSADVKATLKVECNTAIALGHKIQGKEPCFIHLKETPETEADLVVTLAIVLKKTWLDKKLKRLLIHKSDDQKRIFHRLLRLLGKDYFYYDSSTQWKIMDSRDSSVNALPEDGFYTMLTSPEGCRGDEAAECISIIDLNDSKLTHLTLESLSCVTENLIIISTSHINSKSIQKCSTGYFLKELLAAKYLREICVTFNPNMVEPCSGKNNVFEVNNNHLEYKNMKTTLESRVNYPDTQSEVINAEEIIFKNLYPPQKVSSIVCSYITDSSCELQWENRGYDYTVTKQEERSSNWEVVANNIRSNRCIISNIEVEKTYQFCVKAVNQTCASEDSIVKYCHRPFPAPPVTFKDIAEAIHGNNLKELGNLLSTDPNCVFMTDENGWTPLMLAVMEKNEKMVLLLVAQGSNVWAETKMKSNSYVLAAMNGHDKILDILCQHNIDHINRKDLDKGTILHYAASYGNVACVDVLLRFNADTTIKNKYDKTAYEMAGKIGNKQKKQDIEKKIENAQ